MSGSCFRRYCNAGPPPHAKPFRWPLPNVWEGVSVEDQATADARIPELLKTPAAVRFVSYEPALAEVDFTRLYGHICMGGSVDVLVDALRGKYTAAWHGRKTRMFFHEPACPALDWIIIGGESGPGARPFDIEWARETIRQCKAAGVPVFCKQLGSKPVQSAPGCLPTRYPILDPKGSDIELWPADVRVRDFPR